MTFTLKIKLGNDAMRTGSHIAGALRAVTANLFRPLHRGDSGIIRDINGNTVGEWKVG